MRPLGAVESGARFRWPQRGLSVGIWPRTRDGVCRTHTPNMPISFASAHDDEVCEGRGPLEVLSADAPEAEVGCCPPQHIGRRPPEEDKDKEMGGTQEDIQEYHRIEHEIERERKAEQDREREQETIRGDQEGAPELTF